MSEKRQENDPAFAPPTDAQEAGPLRRWLQRRRQVKDEDEKRSVAPADGDALSLASPVPSEAKGDNAPSDSDPTAARRAEGEAEEKILTDADMPPLESLDEHSDYSGFLSSGVSEDLRRRALRKLFFSAAFNVRDGLDDYDDDFTSFEGLGDMVTADMKHQREVEAERARAEAETSEEIEKTRTAERSAEDANEDADEDERGQDEKERSAAPGEDREGFEDEATEDSGAEATAPTDDPEKPEEIAARQPPLDTTPRSNALSDPPLDSESDTRARTAEPAAKTETISNESGSETKETQDRLTARDRGQKPFEDEPTENFATAATAQTGETDDPEETSGRLKPLDPNPRPIAPDALAQTAEPTAKTENISSAGASKTEAAQSQSTENPDTAETNDPRPPPPQPSTISRAT